MKTFLTLLLVAGLSFQAMAGEDRGGGNEIGLEFHSLISSALATAKKNDLKLYQLMQKHNLEMILARSKIVVTDETLYVDTPSGKQESIAVNSPSQMLVQVNKPRWSKLSDTRLKQGVAVHELLSLAGVEKTGVYTISGAYVSSAGLSVAVLNSSVIAIPPNLTAASRFRVTVKDAPYEYYASVESMAEIARLRVFLRKCENPYDCKDVIYDIDGKALGLNMDHYLRPGSYILRLAYKLNSSDYYSIYPQDFHFTLVGGENYSVPLSSVTVDKLAMGKIYLTMAADLSNQQNLSNIESYLSKRAMEIAMLRGANGFPGTFYSWAVAEICDKVLGHDKKNTTSNPSTPEALACKEIKELAQNEADLPKHFPRIEQLIKTLVGIQKLSPTEFTARYWVKDMQYSYSSYRSEGWTTSPTTVKSLIYTAEANSSNLAKIYLLPGQYIANLKNESGEEFTRSVSLKLGEDVTFKP